MPLLSESLRSAVREFVGKALRQGEYDKVPVLLPLAMLVTSPLYFSGPLRAATRLAAVASLLVCCLAAGGIAVFAWTRLQRAPPAWSSWKWWTINSALELSVLVLPIFAIWRLWNSDFSGFPNIDGWDGGSHVFVKDRFMISNPDEYFGFVSQYSFSYWFGLTFAANGFRSVAASFNFAVAFLAGTTALITVATIRTRFRDGAAEVVLGILAMLVMGAVLLDGGALIALHYLQGMGFYPQVFATIGLCALWAADALVRGTLPRAVCILMAAVLLRYSYGLNLPDALCAVGVLSLLGARSAPIPSINCVVGIVAAFASYKGFVALEPLFALWGGLAQHSVPQLLSTHLALALAFGVVVALLPPPSDALVRAVRFPIAFAAVNAASCAYFQAISSQYYYVNKYQFSSCCLLAGAGTVIAAHLAGDVLAAAKGFRAHLWAVGLPVIIAVLIVVGVGIKAPVAWKQVFFRYVVSYKERTRAKGAPYSMLRPLADTRALRTINTVLAREHKGFGGYLTNNFPLFSFMNGAMGHHTVIQTFFAPNKQPGHCVFWVSAQDDVFPNGPAAELDAWRAELAGSSAAACERYQVRWKLTPQSLCHVCF